ncbi:hypothetical protein VTH82DRAFT_522 [Thermothelomyces myriococcoides]
MSTTRAEGADPAPSNFTTASSSSTARSPSDERNWQSRHGSISGSGSPASSRVDYAVGATPSGRAADPTNMNRSSTEVATKPSVARRPSRVGTFRTVDDFEEFAVGPGWYPGAEPGVDPSKPDGGHASMPTLSAPCTITVVDFSQEHLSIQRHDNETLPTFLSQTPPDWIQCRWINVNGLSWDVIKALGRYKNLHRLAIEDMMNTRNRTKVEWFPTHAFIVLTLQKLVHLYDPESDSSDSESEEEYASQENVSDQSERGTSTEKLPSYRDGGRRTRSRPASFSDLLEISQLRTLQRYHASPDDPRTQYMEKHSALSSRKLAVACEQVSIFLTNDNCIISFFEQSGQDIEKPIIRRLQTDDTIIRQSCDASMVGQAIMDEIIDLAIPVAACYGDVISDIELDVLTRPDIGHTKSLYILISEINKILSFINPITTLINALRDHEAELAPDAIMPHLLDPNHGVIITPLTNIYLGDVLDHCLLITETLNQLKGLAEGMIGLIFNTISANQNESMKQLTIVTIIFLPLTFLTGYFGQNFEPFSVLQEDIGYFWKIAIPVVAVTIIVLLREAIYEYCRSLIQRRHILQLRRSRRKKRK